MCTRSNTFFISITAFLLSALVSLAQQKPASAKPAQSTKPVVKTAAKPVAKPPHTPPSDTTFCIKADFRANTVKHLSYDKCQTRYNDRDGNTSRLCTHYDIALTVQERRTNGYKIKWHFNKITLGDGFDKETPFRRSIETLLQGINVEFVLDTMGAFVETDDWFDTKAQLTKKVDSLKTLFATDSNANAFIQKLYRIVSEKDIIEPTVTQLAELYFSTYGRFIQLNIGTRTGCRFPNIFAGDPFPANGRLKIDSLDWKNKKLSLVWHQGIDTVASRDIIKKALVKQARINARPIPKDENIPRVDVYENYRLRYNMRDTWFTYIDYTKVTTNGKAGERDNITMVVLK